MSPKDVSQDLLSRLNQLRKEKEEAAKDEDTEAMTMQELEDQLVTYGKYQGTTFMKLYDDKTSYVAWFLAHVKDHNPNQHRLLRYINLRVEEEEEMLNLQPPDKNAKNKKTPATVTPGKPKPTVPPPRSSHSQGYATNIEVDSSTENSTMNSMVAQQAASENRLDQIESVLQQVLTHLQHLNIKKEHE
jgi:hypothetical protein